MAEPLWPSAAAAGVEEYNPLMDHGSSNPSSYRGPPPPSMDGYRPPPPPGPTSPGHRPPPPPMNGNNMYNQYPPPSRNMRNGYPYQPPRRQSGMPSTGGPSSYNNNPMPYGSRNGPWHQSPHAGHGGPPPPPGSHGGGYPPPPPWKDGPSSPSGPRFDSWPPINDYDSSGRSYDAPKKGSSYGGGPGGRPMYGSGGSGTNPNSGLWMGGGAPNPLF